MTDNLATIWNSEWKVDLDENLDRQLAKCSIINDKNVWELMLLTRKAKTKIKPKHKTIVIYTDM